MFLLPCSTRSWSPTAARSPSASSARSRSSASRRSPCTRSSTATRCTSSAPTRPTCSARARRPRATSTSTKILEVMPRVAAPRPSTPATASWPRTRRSRRRCEDAGITFIGPPASAIEAMGSKTRARELMKAAGVPIVPGHDRAGRRRRGRAQDHRRRDRLPGRGQGGGRRRRQGLPRRARPRTSSRTPSRAPRARARSSSATRRVYLERYLPDPRHVEVQVLADTHGNVIHLGERDCSVQRRHQKLIEESPGARPSTRRCASASARSASTPRKAVDYVGAGTIEGLLAGRRVLLPRDEHARAGRALRDRDGDRHRHRQGGHPRRRRRAALGHARTTSSCAATRSSAASTPRTPAKNFAPAPGQIGELPRARRAPACASTPASAPGGEISPDVRPDGGQADRLGRRPRAGHARACCARWTSTRSRASRR